MFYATPTAVWPRQRWRMPEVSAQKLLGLNGESDSGFTKFSEKFLDTFFSQIRSSASPPSLERTWILKNQTPSNCKNRGVTNAYLFWLISREMQHITKQNNRLDSNSPCQELSFTNVCPHVLQTPDSWPPTFGFLCWSGLLLPWITACLSLAASWDFVKVLCSHQVSFRRAFVPHQPLLLLERSPLCLLMVLLLPSVLSTASVQFSPGL